MKKGSSLVFYAKKVKNIEYNGYELVDYIEIVINCRIVDDWWALGSFCISLL